MNRSTFRITSCNHAVSPQIALISSVASAVGFNACNSATCFSKYQSKCVVDKDKKVLLFVEHGKTCDKHDASIDALFALKQRYFHRQRFPEIH